MLLLRHTGMRSSDVARLERSRLRGSNLCIRTMKNHEPLWLPIPPDVARSSSHCQFRADGPAKGMSVFLLEWKRRGPIA